MSGHFAAEELLMEKAEYAKFAEHKKMHSVFLERLERLRDECQRRQTELMGVLVELLETWFRHHEETADCDAASVLGAAE